MSYSLKESPLVTDTISGIRITTFTSSFMGIQKPGIQYASAVSLPCCSLDAVEKREYRTESEGRLGHAELVETYKCWSRAKVQFEILKGLGK